MYIMEDGSNPSLHSDEVATPETDWVTTLGGQLRAASVEKRISTPNNTPFTTAPHAEAKQDLIEVDNPITRRSLRQQEREAHIKNHPIKHLGYRALYRIFKPFSK